MTIKIVTVTEMIAAEKQADANGHSYSTMMDLAGKAVADRVMAHLPSKDNITIIVLVGKGNNGGDGLVAAKYIKYTRPDVEVLVYQHTIRPQDPVLNAARGTGVRFINQSDLATAVKQASIIIDALLGTGIKLPLRDDMALLLELVKVSCYPHVKLPTLVDPTSKAIVQQQLPIIIAVDCPSGLDCDTGAISPQTLAADETVTFAAAKHGHLLFDGAASVGNLRVADIGIMSDFLPPNAPILLDPYHIRSLLPKRTSESHKGTYGKALITAGSQVYAGAATLAARAASRSGAGLVTLAIPHSIQSLLASTLPEITWLPLPHTDGYLNMNSTQPLVKQAQSYDSLLVGCGMGNTPTTQQFMWNLLNQENLPSLIIDADGLNVLSQMPHWQLPPHTIITPHPREFARLANTTTAEVQANRWELAKEKAQEWNVVIVLKGAYTAIATPDGQLSISPFATANLAMAGTGDVLAGCIASLRAQGLNAHEAAQAGVWLHGWVGQYGLPKRGGLALDVANNLGQALSHIT